MSTKINSTSGVGFALFVGALALAAPTSAFAGYSDYSCNELWVARNQIYAENGYCFQTRRGIRTFGNAGCQYDDVTDVPLTRSEQRTIDAIRRAERRNYCG